MSSFFVLIPAGLIQPVCTFITHSDQTKFTIAERFGKERQPGLKLLGATFLMLKINQFCEKYTSCKLASGLTNHTSQIINENLNKNFFDFVNDYRINEVKKCLSDSKFSHYTLLAIAYECGFNSKSSFNSLFKIKTGLTPSEYQKKLKA